MTPQPRPSSNLRIETNPSDEGGHEWRRLYVDDVLVDVKCRKCGARPLDLIGQDNRMRPCSMVEGIMRGFGF